MACGDAHQLTSVDATRPSDAARYRYDAAGNPVDRAELGLDVTNSFNNLNQIVTGSWTGATLTVAGTVNYPVGSISVNGQPGTVYPDSTFDVAAVPVVPGTNTLTATYIGPAYTNAPMTATDTSTVVLGDTLYSHDANGNLTSDATFTYQYDLANQLTNVIRKADNTTVLSCRYDALGRRVEAIRADGTVDRYVYFPGTFLVLAVLDETNAPKEFYTRGPDLSGSLDAAGGIGGILACTYPSSPTALFYHHADLMGNIIVLTDGVGGMACSLRYTSFGQLTSSTGAIFPRYQFSTKEFDVGTALNYYGYRYYSARDGRWLNRDPIVEQGGVNLYGALGNAAMTSVDYYGERIVIRKGPDDGNAFVYGGQVISPTSEFVDMIITAFQNAATHTDGSTGRQLECMKIVAKTNSFFRAGIEIHYQPGRDAKDPCCENSSIISYMMNMMDMPNNVYVYQTSNPRFGGASHLATNKWGRKVSKIFIDPHAALTAPLMRGDGGRGDEAVMPFDVKLMHELLGHAEFWLSGRPYSHPMKLWNVFDSEDPRKDPILERENEYRAWQGYPLRYEKYYASPSQFQ